MNVIFVNTFNVYMIIKAVTVISEQCVGCYDKLYLTSKLITYFL